MKAFLFFSLTILLVNADNFSEKNRLFTASVYKEVIKSHQKNVLVSPLSAEIILALAQSGAKGETAKEIRSAIHRSSKNLQSSFKEVLESMKNKSYSLSAANKIYVNQDFEIKDDFKSVAQNYFQSDIENIDFSKPQEAANTINQWVEERTQKKIKNLVDPSTIGSIPAILINTIYFKSQWWDVEFHKYPLMKTNFYVSSEESLKVDMMHLDGVQLNYLEDTNLGATFVEVPLQDDAAMVFVVPSQKLGLEKVEAKAEEVFKNRQFTKEILKMSVPVFKIESTIDFKTILTQLGVKKAFQAGEADFSGIAGKKGDLAVGGVLQKTYIDVNKDGVEAAAATDLWFYLSGPPRATKTVVLDHPFIFYIKVKDVILFAGKVTKPSY